MSAPDENGWIKWDGGECPVPPGTVGKIRLGYETLKFAESSKPIRLDKIDWSKNVSRRYGSRRYDIVAYRITRYALPKENL